MKKFKIRLKHKNIIKWIIVLGVMSVIICAILIIITYDNKGKQQNEILLLEQEKSTYEHRLEVVNSANIIYDYTLNGYQKIIKNMEINTLIIGDTSISENNRYKIIPDWQQSFEESINQMNNRENHFSNILLRGSNIMWAYMQVSADLKKMDFDFAIIEISINDIVQLSDAEIMLYYEALVRQLNSQFLDIKVFLILNDSMTKSLSEVDLIKYKNMKEKLEEINKDYNVDTIIVDQIDKVTGLISEKIAKDILLQINKNESIVVNPLTKHRLETDPLFNIEGLASNVLPIQAKGFMINKGLLVNNSSRNFIEYEIEDSFIFLNYVRFKDGCKFRVYIDDELYSTLDSYSETTGVGVLTFPVSKEKRKVRIEAISEAESGKYLMMDNLLVGY